MTEPVKKATAKKAPARKPRRTAAQIEADLRAQIEAELREKVEAEVKAQMAAEAPIATEPTVRYNDEVDYSDDPDVLTFHFLEDGLVFLGRVRYRGEEVTLRKGTREWEDETDRKGNLVWLMSSEDQLNRWGRVLWRRGPWRGPGFDLENPELTEEERQRLLTIQREREERLKKP